MQKIKKSKPIKTIVTKPADKKEWPAHIEMAIANAEARVDALLDFLPPEHPRVKDAKQYVKELEAI